MKWVETINFERWTFLNFILLALFGVLLRCMLCFPLPALNYLNILHAHSHFAFSGWMFMALVILLIKQMPPNTLLTFKWILLLTQIVSFGMLISFSLQGYKAISIIFSTLFLFISYWFSYAAYNKLANKEDKVSGMLIKASLWFLVISSLGPLALGALKATGNTGIVYQNAIYFYLHFQMNGWMLFAALALISSRFIKLDNYTQRNLGPWVNMFILSSIPLFFIFTLWSKPSSLLQIIALVGALLNVLSWAVLIHKLKNKVENLPFLIRIAVLAISIKVVFQVLVCVPQIGEWAFSNRNLIIGYVHLITLGCITPVIFSLFIKQQVVRSAEKFYVLLVVTYLAILFFQPVLGLFHIVIPHLQQCLLIVSLLFCLSGIIFYNKLLSQFKSKSISNFQTSFTKIFQ